jgi:sugar phosphate isomerase/epimerase
MSWHLGISTGACTDLPIANVLPAIRAAGATGVEVGTPPRHFDPWSAEQVDALALAFQTTALEPVSIHTPFGGLLDLADPNPHHRQTAIDAAVTAGEALRRLGGRMIVVHPSDFARHEHDVSARLADIRRSLALLAERCARLDLALLVETPLPHLIGGHPDEFDCVMTGLPDSVGVCLDTGHTSLGGYWQRFVDVAGPRLRHVHASDNHGHRDDHLPPGLGTIRWPDIVRSLRDVRFTGWIMLELACPGGQPLDTYLRDAYVRACRLLELNSP